MKGVTGFVLLAAALFTTGCAASAGYNGYYRQGYGGYYRQGYGGGHYREGHRYDRDWDRYHRWDSERREDRREREYDRR